jgi:hypothetical protein
VIVQTMEEEEFYGGLPAARTVRQDQTEQQRARYLSREVDFGVWWTDDGITWPHWRVSWVQATGELYAIRQVGSGGRGLEIRILGVERDEQELERRLEGWPEACGPPDGLQWITARLVPIESEE